MASSSNNNKFVWTDEETEVFLGLIHESMGQRPIITSLSSIISSSGWYQVFTKKKNIVEHLTCYITLEALHSHYPSMFMLWLLAI